MAEFSGLVTTSLFLSELTVVKVISPPFVAFPVAVLSPRGWTNEWHLLFPKLFQHLDFGFVPGLRHVVVLFEPAFS